MSRFHNLGQRLAANPVEDPEGEHEPSDTPTKLKKKDTDMSDENHAALDAAKKEGHDAGFKAASDRMTTVFASEHYAGREAMAAKLLGKPAMSAEDIIDVLADTPKAKPEATALTEEQQREAAEKGGREQMKAELEKTGNSNIDANGGGGAKTEDFSALWTNAIAANNPGYKA